MSSDGTFNIYNGIALPGLPANCYCAGVVLFDCYVRCGAHHPRGSSLEARSAASDLPTASTASAISFVMLDKAAICNTKGNIESCHGASCPYGVFAARRRTSPHVAALLMKFSTLVVNLLVVAYVAGTTTARDLPGVSGKTALTSHPQIYALPCCIAKHLRYSSGGGARRLLNGASSLDGSGTHAPDGVRSPQFCRVSCCS